MRRLGNNTAASLGIAGVMVVLLLLGGCLHDGSDDEAVSGKSLKGVGSESELLALLKAAYSKRASGYDYAYTGGDDGMDMAAEDGASSPAQTSSTTLQVSGVDEADWVKNDGSHLFIASPAGYSYDYGIAVDGAELDASYKDETLEANRLRILSLASEPSATELVAELQLGESGDPPLRGIYLQQDAQGTAQKLITVSSNEGWSWYYYGGWQGGTTLVQIIDVSDPANPLLEKRVEFDGTLVASRRIDNRLYLVNRYSPQLEGYVDYPYDTQSAAQNAQIISEATLDDMLPDVRYDDGSVEELLSAGDCFLTEGSDPQNLYPDIITFSVFDLATAETTDNHCFLGSTEAIYVSQQAAYLATSQYSYQLGDEDLLYYDGGYQTDIHKFSLDDDATTYVGSERIEGHLGWEQDKKSFRFGEQGGYLVVATSLGESWDNSASTRLTVIGAGESGSFATVNALPNSTHPEAIGKPGERLYSVRYVDGAAYLVTFRVTDPLYVVDLSEPTDPYLAGELEIDGYSDYLHPLPGGLLLGVGKDAIPDASGDESRGAWYQGLKLSLFDVSDWSAPREINSLIIGKRGTESAVLHDHHAFTILDGDEASGRPTRIAIPLELHESASPYGYSSGEPWEWYGWTHTGLYLFELDTSATSPLLTSLGTMVVEQGDGGYGDYWYSGERDRAVLSETGAYYIHDDEVWAADFDNLDAMDGPN